MSYYICLRGAPCDKCGHLAEPECPGPTYNLTPLFHFALTGRALSELDDATGLRILSGKRAGDTVGQLLVALQRVQELTDDELLGWFTRGWRLALGAGVVHLAQSRDDVDAGIETWSLCGKLLANQQGGIEQIQVTCPYCQRRVRHDREHKALVRALIQKQERAR